MEEKETETETSNFATFPFDICGARAKSSRLVVTIGPWGGDGEGRPWRGSGTGRWSNSNPDFFSLLQCEQEKLGDQSGGGGATLILGRLEEGALVLRKQDGV